MIGRCLLLAVLIINTAPFAGFGTAAAQQPAAQAPAAAEKTPDRALLQLLEQLRRVARQAGGELWPEWDPTATPLAIFKGTEMAVLVGHPSPPSNFRRLQTDVVSAPVFVADSTAGFLRANTAQPFAGALTSFFSYEDFMGKPVAEGLALAIHELFHAQLNRVAPRKFGDAMVVVWGKYPEFSARNRASLAIEAELLHRAVTAKDDAAARQSAAGFLAVRAERRKELGPELARYESGEESSEGLARYIEWRLLGLLPSINPSYKDAAEAAGKRLEALKNINALERDRERFYILGMAEAALLDRFRPQWKKEFESTPLLLDELLSQAVPAASPAETTRVMERLSFNKLLAEQKKALAEREEQGTEKLTAFALASGDRLVVEVGALKNKVMLRGFNPNGTVELTPGQVFYNFLLLDLGADPGPRMRLEVRGIPAFYDRAQDAFWCVLPSDAIAKAVEGYTRASETGRLVVKAPGFYAEFSGMQVERRGRELRIRAIEELIKKPPLKPPVFVRP